MPRLQKLFAGTDVPDQYFYPAETFGNVKSTIANVMLNLKEVAALWSHRSHPSEKISLKQWVESGGSILVLGGKEDLQDSLEVINRVMFTMIAKGFLSAHESHIRTRLWFFCDELKTAGRLDALPKLLNARSKGVRCVLGFQDIEGLVTAYGNNETPKEILSRCGTITWLRLSSPDTAKWASERSGDLERYEHFQTQTKDGKTTGEQLAKRESILAPQFQNLPHFSGGCASGFHLITGLDGIFPSAPPFEFPKSSTPDFIRRPLAEQELSPWNQDDESWLDGGGANPPESPPPGPPDRPLV